MDVPCERYFQCPPDQLGPDHIRQYQAYLFRERKLAPNSVIQRHGGLRFFYIKTMKQSWSAELTPYGAMCRRFRATSYNGTYRALGKREGERHLPAVTAHVAWSQGGVGETLDCC